MAVANAGFGVVGTIEKLSVEDYRRQFETNVFARRSRPIKACLPELRKTRGRLVLIGSVAGYISTPNASPYAMSKFAIRALALALGPELAPSGVSVTLISPGFIESEIRQVDNRGVHHSHAKDPLPSWLPMPADVAARKIVVGRVPAAARSDRHGARQGARLATAVRAVGAQARDAPRRQGAPRAEARLAAQRIHSRLSMRERR